MTNLDQALFKELKKQAKRLDKLGFIKWSLDNIIVRNYDAIDWIRAVCGVADDADLEQIYTKLKQNANNN